MRSSLLSSLSYPAYSLSLSLSRYPLSPFSLFQHLYNAPSLSYRQLSISVVYVPIAMQLFLSFSPVSLLARTSFSLPLSIPQIYRTQNTQFSLSFFLYPSRFLSLKSGSHAELPPPITPTSFDRFELTVSFLLEIQNCSISHMYMCVYIYIYIFIYTHNLSSPPPSLFLSFSFSLVLFARLVTLSPFNVTILPLAFSFARSSIVYFCPARIQRRSSLPSLSPVRARPTTPTRKHEVSRREPNGCSGTSGSVTNLASIVPEFFSAARSFAVSVLHSDPWRTVSLTGAVQCHK